jgi:16S rRNA (guanine527-N7)-methyltransferase
MLDRDLLQTTLARWNVACAPPQIDLFAAYLAALIEWNGRMNLVAGSTLADPTRRHLLDSLVLATALPAPPASLADVGSGAGLPGIPLAILWPQTQVTLIESIGKKADFLRHVAGSLPLPNVQVLSERAEAAGQDRAYRERAEVVTARAVASLATLAELCLPLCRVGGRWLAPKGPDVRAEVQDSEEAVHILGAELEGVYDVLIPDEPTRSLVVFHKRRPTPPAYPRPVGVPAKKPL